MQRTNIIELKPSPKQRRILKEMLLLSSCVYNMANYEMRQAFFNKEKVPSFHQLQQRLQNKPDYQLLGRSYALPRIQIYSETNSARFKLIKSKTQKHVGLPKYLKNRKTNTTIPSYLVTDSARYHIGKIKVSLPLSYKLRKKHDIKHFTIPYNGILRWQGKQCRGQIRYEHKKFYLYQSVELPDQTPTNSTITAGIDLGIKNLITVVTSDGAERIIGSKRFLRQWEHHSKLISDEQARIATSNRRTSKWLQKLYHKRNIYQNHLFNNIVSKTFRLLTRRNVQTIYLGDLNGIREDNDKGAKLNRMTHNYWSYDKLRKKIENKAEQYGMTLVLQEESYTSRTCPICYDSSKQNVKDRIFLCTFCGYVNHRDVVGATNIMLKGMRDPQWRSAHRDETVPASEVLA